MYITSFCSDRRRCTAKDSDPHSAIVNELAVSDGKHCQLAIMGITGFGLLRAISFIHFFV